MLSPSIDTQVSLSSSLAVALEKIAYEEMTPGFLKGLGFEESELIEKPTYNDVLFKARTILYGLLHSDIWNVTQIMYDEHLSFQDVFNRLCDLIASWENA